MSRIFFCFSFFLLVSWLLEHVKSVLAIIFVTRVSRFFFLSLSLQVKCKIVQSEMIGATVPVAVRILERSALLF